MTLIKDVLNRQKKLSDKDKAEILEFVNRYGSQDENIDKVKLRRDIELLVFNAKERIKANIRQNINRSFKKWM